MGTHEDGNGSWTPPEDLKDHTDQPIGETADFFVPPPEDIGPLSSACTSLDQRTAPTPLGTRALLALLAGVGGALIGFAIVTLVQVREPIWIILWYSVPPVLLMAIALYATRFNHSCSYVGRDGVAFFECSGDRHKISRSDRFLFGDASDLRTAMTAHFTNGVYTHTAYSFSWTNPQRRTAYKINGQYKSKSDTPPATDPYHYARAAEVAWSQRLLQDALEQLRLQGSYMFPLDGGDWVKLGPGWIEFRIKGQTCRCEQDDLASMNAANGYLTLTRRDARKGWFSSEGVFTFPYRSMANAQLFLHLIRFLSPPGE